MKPTLQRAGNWYERRLQKYFDEYFKPYEETAEFYVNPAPNKWKFDIPELGITVRLCCTERGIVTEMRDKI